MRVGLKKVIFLSLIVALLAACGSEHSNEETAAESNNTAGQQQSAADATEPAPTNEGYAVEEVGADAQPESEPLAEPEPAQEGGSEVPTPSVQTHAELDALVERLDFTAARVLATQLAEASADAQERALYSDRAQRYSTLSQDLPHMREMFVFLAGNRQQQQQAMGEIFAQEVLAQYVINAVVAPEVEATQRDDEILPIVLELARAVNHYQSFAPALRRHQGLPPGAMRESLTVHIQHLLEQHSQALVGQFQRHILAQEARDIADLLPFASQQVVAEQADGSFAEALPLVILAAAEAVDDDAPTLRGGVFQAAILLGDNELSRQVVERLGDGEATMAGLPPGWSGNDLGTVAEPGSVSFRGERFVVRAGGEDYWGSGDNGYWIWRKVEGDVSLRARLHSIDAAHDYTKAGIAFRAANTSESRHASLLASPGQDRDQGYRFVLGSRSRDGGGSSNDGSSKIALPQWLQLQRQGGEVIASVSEDGEEWDELARIDLDLGDSFYMGLVLSARHGSEMAEAEIEIPLEDLL